MDKAGQQIDKRTDGKYHDQLEQAEEKVGELADKRMAANGTAAATADGSRPPHRPRRPTTRSAWADPAATSAPLRPAAPGGSDRKS